MDFKDLFSHFSYPAVILGLGLELTDDIISTGTGKASDPADGFQ
jgi:hypothetical protein